MPLRVKSLLFACICLLGLGASSCITPDYTLGKDIVPLAECFVTRSVTIPIGEIEMGTADSLVGYSTVRMAIGSLRDDTYGLVRRATAVTLVPVSDEINWGHNVKIQSFTLYTARDTVSYIRPEDENIIQRFDAYALPGDLDTSYRYSCDPRLRRDVISKGTRVCIGSPTYNGGDSLVLKLTKEFAATYIPQEAFGDGDDVVEKIDTLDAYTRKHPGIYICCEDPVGIGGRSNFFDVALEKDENMYVTNCFAQLNFTADFGKRTQVDTAVLFCFGPSGLKVKSLEYYVFNTCEHDRTGASGEVQEILSEIEQNHSAKVKDKLYVEGGIGIKPLIRARYLRESIIEAIRDTVIRYSEELGLDLTQDDVLDSLLSRGNVMVNQCRIILPYKYDATDWEYYKHFYPRILNPTLRLHAGDTVVFGSITDSVVSDENQGKVDRSNSCYRPDIAFHIQEILKTSYARASDLEKCNIWLLTVATEKVPSAESSQYSADYYNQLSYMNYYNNMMYGGAYGYDYYGNYYNYNMMNNYYSSYGKSYADVDMVDPFRYYNAVLSGPEVAEADLRPRLTITYTLMDRRKVVR